MRNFKFLVMLIVLLVACPSFKRNPNLRLLLKEEGYSLLSPRWTKNGWVYYIKHYYEGENHYGSGEVWRITDNGKEKELVFSEPIVIMDVSPSETLLIAFRSQGLPLILYNIKTAIEETLLTTCHLPLSGLQFGSSDTLVYYADQNGLHKLNIHSKSDTLIIPGFVEFFDIYHDSLVYYGYTDTQQYPHQRITDIFTGAIIFESTTLMKGIFAQCEDYLLLISERKFGLQLYEISNGTLITLDAAPYKITVWGEVGNCVDFNPSDSKQIIFSAVESDREGFIDGGFELWILEKF